jgi:hypothetical protein
MVRCEYISKRSSAGRRRRDGVVGVVFEVVGVEDMLGFGSQGILEI